MNNDLGKSEKGPKHGHPYAFLSQRFYAGCVDGIIVSLFVIPISLIIAGIVFYFYSAEIFLYFTNNIDIFKDMTPETQFGMVGGVLVIIGLDFLIVSRSLAKMFYYSYYSSSPQQATPGMKMHSLKLVDYQGRRVSFGRAFLREMACFFSFWFFLIGYFMIGWTSCRQGFHDMVTSTYVINTLETQDTDLAQAQQEKGYFGGFGVVFVHLLLIVLYV